MKDLWNKAMILALFAIARFGQSFVLGILTAFLLNMASFPLPAQLPC